LTSADLALLEAAGDDCQLVADSLAASSQISVWKDDDISPASFIYSHKTSNPILKWTPEATSRLVVAKKSLAMNCEVVIHSD